MKINHRPAVRQARRSRFFFRVPALVTAALCAAVYTVSCSGKKAEAPLVPPVTAPLSRTVIGFGVVNVSYAHVSAEPADGSISTGYLRRGSLVRVLERRYQKKDAGAESWVLVEGTSRGWLREQLLDIFDNELRARTAAESMSG